MRNAKLVRNDFSLGYWGNLVGERRRTPVRYRVHLSVRFAVAHDFVTQYAENLSAGGLFVTGVYDLAPLERVRVEIELPGMGAHAVVAEVAHVLTVERAREVGRAPGVGLMLVETPPEFVESLATYLVRLGRRADTQLFVYDPRHSELLRQAGYRVLAAPDPVDVVKALVKLPDPVLAVVAPSDLQNAYQSAVDSAGGGVPVLAMDFAEQLDQILNRLDREI